MSDMTVNQPNHHQRVRPLNVPRFIFKNGCTY